jgi:hypothetical protein
MVDRLAENGAVQFGQASTATDGTVSRLAGAGQIEAEIRRLVAEGFYTAKVAAYTVKGRLINAALDALPPVIPFSPLSLFSSGEPGAWYDPSDLTTLYQDAAGTTPVTAVEQPVGLMLDKRTGSTTLGTELVSNNTFDTDTVWTKGAGWSIGSGVATKTAGTASSLSQAISLTAGKTYRIVYTITRSAGTITLRFTGGTTVSATSKGTSGTYVDYLTALTGNTTLDFNTTSTFAGTVDDVYVKEVTGNDACQPTSTARPTLKALYNLLTYTEQFDNAVWAKTASSISSNVTATTDPSGGNTADKLIEDTANSTHYLEQLITTVATSYSLSVYAKAGERNWIRLFLGSAGNAYFNLTTGDVGTATSVTTSILSVGDGWYKCTITGTTTAATNAHRIYVVNADNSPTYTGDGTSGIYLWGADLRVTNDGVGLPAYQRVASSTDYDTTGFPPYLSFDGTDDHMLASPIDLNTVTSDGLTRRNLLSFPTMFGEGYWLKLNSTLTQNSTTSPYGTLTADTITDNATNSWHTIQNTLASNAAGTYTFSAYVKAGTLNYACVSINTNSQARGYGVVLDLTTGSVASVLTYGTISGESYAVTSVGNGWYRISVTLEHTTSGAVYGFISTSDSATPTNNYALPTYSGSGDTIYAWGAQLEVGTSPTAFQNIGTDEALIVAGQRKLKESTSGPLFFSATSGTTPIVGSFNLFAPALSASTSYRFTNRGSSTAVNADTGVTYVAPHTGVVSGIGSISGDLARIRVNGSTIATTTTDQGTGNYAAASAFLIGRNGSTGSTYFQGRLYNLVVRMAASTDTQISDTETYVNNLTKAY